MKILTFKKIVDKNSHIESNNYNFNIFKKYFDTIHEPSLPKFDKIVNQKSLNNNQIENKKQSLSSKLFNNTNIK